MDYDEEVPLQCVFHVNGDAKHSGASFKQTWETAGIIAKARKKHQKRSKYLDLCESNLYCCPIIVFTVDITVNLQTESRGSVLMPVLLMPVLP